MSEVTLNQYKGLKGNDDAVYVVAENIIEAATLLSDTIAGTEPSLIQKTLTGIRVSQPKLNVQFITNVLPAEALAAGCSATPPSFTVIDGTKVIFYAKPAAGWEFVSWSKDSVVLPLVTTPLAEIAVTDPDPLLGDIVTYTATFQLIV